MQVSYEKTQPILQQFKKNWSVKSIDSIEQTLADVSEELRDHLLIAMLQSDMYRRRQSNQRMPNKEYVKKFSNIKNIVKIVEETDAKVTRELEKTGIGDKTGKIIDEYTIGKIIGKGGSAEVYEATNNKTHHKVAIKFQKINAEKTEQERRQTNIDEAQTSNLTSCQYSVQAITCGNYLGEPYIVMDRIDGETLASRVKDGGTLDWSTASSYVKKIADGLSGYHKENHIHCDVKPENVMIDKEDAVRLLDFGFAREFSDPKNRAVPNGEFVGTEAYAPPEAWKGSNALVPQSDLYCLGGTFLYLLTGFTTRQWYEIDKRKKGDAPSCSLSKFLSEKGKKVPSRVVKVLTRLLEPDPENRFQTAQEVVDVLNKFDKPRLNFWHGVALTFLVVVLLGGAYFRFGYDSAQLKRAVKLEQQGNLENAIAEVKNVRPGRLSGLKRFDFFMLQARGRVAKGEYVKALDYATDACQTFERLSDPQRSNVYRCGADVWVTPSFSNRASNDKNHEKFVDASKKLADFFKKSPVFKTTPAAEARLLTALVSDWLAYSCLAYGNDGDPNSKKTRRQFAIERSSRAIEERQAIINRQGATNAEKREALQNIILTCDFFCDFGQGIETCKQLLTLDSKSKFANRYFGRFCLYDALATSSESVDRRQKDEILNALSFALKGNDSEEERYDILIETAIAALALGVASSEAENKITEEDCKNCVDAIQNALEVAPEPPVYVINGQEWNAFDVRRQANKIKYQYYGRDENLLIPIREDSARLFNKDSQTEIHKYY